MTHNFKRRFLATTLSLALMLNSGAMAFADEGTTGVDGAPAVTASEAVAATDNLTPPAAELASSEPPADDISSATHGAPPATDVINSSAGTSSIDGGAQGESTVELAAVDSPTGGVQNELECDCPPVDSGTATHGADCPLYKAEAPTVPEQSEAAKAVVALINALPTMDELAAVDTESAEFPAYLAKLRLDTAAARAAYDALADAEKAAFDAAVLAKLTALEEVLAAMPVLTAAQTVAVSGTVTKADGTPLTTASTVSLYDRETGVEIYRGSTSGSGVYSFANVAAGSYFLIVNASDGIGHQPIDVAGVAITDANIQLPASTLPKENALFRVYGTSYNYDIHGKDGSGEIRTTFGDRGYKTYLSTKENPLTRSDASEIDVNGVPQLAAQNRIKVSSDFAFISGGKYLQVTYTLENLTKGAIPNVSLGVNTDVQIGGDDKASIYRTPTGFRMVNEQTYGAGAGKQFSLACKDAAGASSVDTLWFGPYNSENANLFQDTTIDEFKGADSALAFSWRNRTLDPEEKLELSALFSVNETAAPPVLPSGDKPFKVYLSATGDKEIIVAAEVQDTAGLTDTLYYRVNGGGEGTLSTVTATGQPINLVGTIPAQTFANPGVYNVEIWIMNSKGAMSEAVTKVITVAEGGEISVEGGFEAGPPPTQGPDVPSGGDVLTNPLTQEKLDNAFGQGNATLDNTTSPPTIHIKKDITPAKPIEIEASPLIIDLGGNTITGKPGETPIIIGGGKVDITGGGTIAGGDSATGTGGNGITGGAGSDITIGRDVTVSGGDGTTGGDGISSGGSVTDNGKTEGGNGSAGNGGDGIDTSGGAGNVVIGGGGSASGGSSGGSSGSGGNATGGNGGGTGSGGDGAASNGSGNITNAGSATGGDGGASGGDGGNGVTGGTGDIAINGGGSATGGDGGGTGSGGAGGDGGNGSSTGGNITVSGGGSSSGGAGGSGATGGTAGGGGNGTITSGGSTTVDGEVEGGRGGNANGDGSGGNGGAGANQGNGTVDGSGTATGGNGGNYAGTGGSGGAGGKGVGGGATAGSGLTATDGSNGIKATTNVNDSKSGTTVTVPDKSALANAALSAAEKQDKTITEISVTLNIEAKSDQPDKAAIEKAIVSQAADIIGAFFEITLDKIITKDGSAQPSVSVKEASEKIAITITIPASMRGGSSYVVIRVHNGTGEALKTTQRGNNLTFKTDKFSTYAIAYSKSGSIAPPSNNTSSDGGGGGGGSFRTPARAKNVIDRPVGGKGTAEALGAAIQKADASGVASTPAYINFANYTALTVDGIKAINEAAVKAVQGKNVKLDTKVQFDNRVNKAVASRVTVDPVKLAAAMTENVGLNVWFDQNKDSQVTATKGKFERIFSNKLAVIAFEQKSPLAVNMELALKLDLSGLDTKNLHFYSYDPATSIYNRIAVPGYWVDESGYSHITAPFGGSIIITDKPLTLK